jgi:uncharacterized protein (DUF302 family)
MKNGMGIVTLASKYSFQETLSRLEGLIQAKGATVFARIDHSGEAEKADLKMPPTVLLIFGSPKMGTSVMLTAPTAAIDLPLKALVLQDSDGKVWLSYNDPKHFAGRFGLSEDQVAPIAGIRSLAKEVVE